ncbi:transglutaminase-like domain-containing protein [Methanimicrococcus blatticola]|nr:transglutaminase-like domain-containing protein [Methanimicrococcus blatticola]MBZ3934911.1 transglutaminase-like domain-containing protein [Methanimicrococcus blatticola]
MKLIPESENLSDYLAETEIIDFSDSDIMAVSDRLNTQSVDKIDLMKRIYEFVRDEISHSANISEQIVTLKASEVLKEKHGICFAKSHLLAALYRLNGIPTGFCYQKLILDDETAPFLIFHGLCGVYVKETDIWVRLDPRGNKAGIDARFSLNPNDEKIAFVVRPEFGEEDFHTVYPNPAPEVIQALTENKTREELWTNLPVKIYGKSSENDGNGNDGDNKSGWHNICERC